MLADSIDGFSAEGSVNRAFTVYTVNAIILVTFYLRVVEGVLFFVFCDCVFRVMVF